jgi:acyl-CoA hydrolase
MTSQSMTKSLEPYKTARVEVPILPDDANPAGNTHGGTILKLVEACGYIAASRFVNRYEQNKWYCVLWYSVMSTPLFAN